MKKHLCKILLIGLVVAVAVVIFAIGAWGAPALSIELEYSQPNGQTFRATTFGDEFFSYAISRDGAVLTREPDGWWVYAGTQVRYGAAPAPANALSEAALLASQDVARPEPSELIYFGASGESGIGAQWIDRDQHLLVLLVEFDDIQIRFEDYWAEQIFGEENSVRSYFRDISDGVINMVPARETQGTANDGIVRVRLNGRHPNTVNNTGRANQLITRDALRAAARYVDFASFDRNRDLRITNDELHILVIVAGHEAAFDQNVQPNVWGHYWGDVMQQYGFIGGRIFTSYSQIGEQQGGRMATIGIIVHELGHSFGLPDFYTSSDSPYPGLGMFCLMASGSWGRGFGGFAGDMPTGLSALSLEMLGLVRPTAVPFGTDFEGLVNSLCSGGRNMLRINVPGHPYEYFLIENRQLAGWDAGMIPWMNLAAREAGGGIAIYRVNNRYRGNLRSGQQVMLLEAVSMNDAFFHAAPERNAALDRFTEPRNTWLAGGGSGWFRFEALSENNPEMTVAITPIITLQPARVRLNYRSGSAQLNAMFAGDGPLTWQVQDESIVTVDANGMLRAQRRRGSTAVAVFDEHGNGDAIRVDVQYAWWQWLIVIFLFGWIWY